MSTMMIRNCHEKITVYLVYIFQGRGLCNIYWKDFQQKLFVCVLKYFVYLFLERREGKEKERERNINVWLPLMGTRLGTWPATQSCALTSNRTCDPLIHSQASTQSTEPHQPWPKIVKYLLPQH